MKSLLSLLLGGLLLTACSATKQLHSSTSSHTQSTTTTFAHRVAAQALRENNVTAKISAEVGADGKEITLGGHLRMRRNEVIQLQLTFLGITEVGRIEFSPEGVLLIDRLRKQYVQARYDQVDFLQQANLDFYALQSLFWAELFVPGHKDVQNVLSRFSLSEAGGHTLLIPQETPRLEYAFLATTATQRLERLTVRPKNGSTVGELVTRYGNYTPFGKQHFPKEIALSAVGAGKTFALKLELSALSNSADWQPHTTPPAKYKQRSAEDAFRSLFSM